MVAEALSLSVHSRTPVLLVFSVTLPSTEARGAGESGEARTTLLDSQVDFRKFLHSSYAQVIVSVVRVAAVIACAASYCCWIGGQQRIAKPNGCSMAQSRWRDTKARGYSSCSQR